MRTQEQTDDYIRYNLEVAIQNMRDACEEAERILKSSSCSETKIGTIMTKFGWANAHAMSQFDNAMDKLKTRREWVEAEQAEEKANA